MSSYTEKLRDVRWQQKRLECLEDSCWQCENCGGNQTLNVHHYWYEPRKAPWDYPDECFAVLCDRCHSNWHENKLKLDKVLASPMMLDFEQAVGLVSCLRLVMQHEDFCIRKTTSGIFIAGLVRGFWPPHELQTLLIDACLEKLKFKKEFWFSDIVEEVTPKEPEYQSLHLFVRHARNWRRSNGW